MKSIAIILAGGKSERAGMLKGLRIFKGRFWLDEQIIRLRDAGFEDIHVGLGFANESYMDSCKELKRVTIHINQNPERGPFSTLKSVLKAIEANENKRILFHVDRPIPSKATLALLDTSAIDDVIKLRFNNQTGHPIALSYKFSKTCLEKNDSENLRQLIRDLDFNRINYINVDDPLILENLNLPEDWERFILM